MKQYLSLVEEILANGELKEDRTGTGTISIFGVQRKYDLRDGFPLVTTKKTLFNAVIHELLWFLKGSTNINDGLTQNTPIWDAWADENGELGPVYGKQWRRWNAVNGREIDQISKAIEMIKTNPDSRRIIVNAWNVGELDQMALPPCHMFFQFYVVNGRLDCQLYQRSADVALGVPFNIASYAALMMMVAQECDLEAGIFTHTMGDAHIYTNHVEGLKKQLTRTPKSLPKVTIAKKPIDQITFEDFELTDYEHDKFIKFKVAV
ncbi:thymidylate synthase [Candidatus Peregrinibacteria bacterium]|jgi:thymidylate synthase|nr:thymidylate synthase [Candidatus Peregrinibacteria bacterium]MBT4631403.1 thymidylate synthase [Candidatus Peregrinibacteria bacterium]MBT5517105.1 thymidylate synthase [Candidatus Peregrinibacteria bacterium]MBT5824011.1 thymidylate synthase [Candidatus Peregrinibacteria bacterium]